MSIKYQIIPVTHFEQNCTLLWCDETLHAAVVDPGGDILRILEAVEENGLVLKKILVTHMHIDHVGGVAKLSGEYSIPIEGPQIEDQFLVGNLPMQGMMFGFPEVRTFTPDRWLNQGDMVRFGHIEMEVLHCPGHTPGHIAFFNAPGQLAIVGDVLFKGSIGRTDLPKGDFDTLISSIHNRLWPLGDDVVFIPGHGPMSSIGVEKRTNPFCHL